MLTYHIFKTELTQLQYWTTTSSILRYQIFNIDLPHLQYWTSNAPSLLNFTSSVLSYLQYWDTKFQYWPTTSSILNFQRTFLTELHIFSIELPHFQYWTTTSSILTYHVFYTGTELSHMQYWATTSPNLNFHNQDVWEWMFGQNPCAPQNFLFCALVCKLFSWAVRKVF
jgi:hypothetical protein